MILRADKIAQQLDNPDNPSDPLVIRPGPDLAKMRASGSASIDIRLGCWFQVFRGPRLTHLDVYEAGKDAPSESQLTKKHYVSFGSPFVLHPRAFVLAVTLEWIRLPSKLLGTLLVDPLGGDMA